MATLQGRRRVLLLRGNLLVLVLLVLLSATPTLGFKGFKKARILDDEGDVASGGLKIKEDDAVGDADAESAEQSASVKFTETVYTQSQANDELQDRVWNTDPDADGRGGSTIMLSNYNQMETHAPLTPGMQGNVENLMRDAKRRAAIASQFVREKQLADSLKGLTPEERGKKTSESDRVTFAKCPEPALMNMFYSLESLYEPGKYVTRDHNDNIVLANIPSTAPDEDKQKASYLMSFGLANPLLVSLESMDKPGFYLQHVNWTFRLTPVKDTSDYKNTASYKVSKGLLGCDQNAISLETNTPLRFMKVSASTGTLVVGHPELGERAQVSFYPRPSLSLPYVRFISDGAYPVRGRKLAADSVFPRRNPNNDITYMFWIKAFSRSQTMTNVFRKGDSPKDLAPAVYVMPNTLRLRIRSATPQSPEGGCDPEFPLQLLEWMHVTFTHTLGRIKVYFNGKVAQACDAGIPSPQTGTLWFSSNDDIPAKVAVADLRFYNRIATLDEIQQAFYDKNRKDPPVPQ